MASPAGPGQTLRAPAWARTELEKLVAGMIVHKADGNERGFETLQDEAFNIIEYYSLDPDSVFLMYGDPEQDPEAIERARAVTQGLFREQLGAFEPGLDLFSICKLKNTNPNSPYHGSIHGFVHHSRLQRLSAYRLVFHEGQFRTLTFVEDCEHVKSLQSFHDYITSFYAGVWGSFRSICIDDVPWDQVVDVILSDIKGMSRGEARSRMKKVIEQNQERCFGTP